MPYFSITKVVRFTDFCFGKQPEQMTVPKIFTSVEKLCIYVKIKEIISSVPNHHEIT